MEITDYQVHVGVKTPVRVLFLADCHLSYADGEDRRGVAAHAQMRYGYFGNALRHLRDALALGREMDMIAIAGDAIDILSHGNLVLFRDMMEGIPYLFTPGNHEFSLERYDDPVKIEQKMIRQAILAPFFPDDLSLSSRVVGGVNLVAIDNSDYCFHPEQTRALRAEIAKGLPILLFMHIPLYEKGLVEWMTREPDRKPMLIGYQGDTEKVLITDDETERVVRLIDEAPEIRAVFAGHIHEPYRGALPGGTPQYVQDGCYRGSVGVITVT